jgi:cell division ATPase FtsA
MAVERIIGIDFGTSTSVIKVKTYNNGVPIEAKEVADYVRFDNKDTVPTLVYKTEDGRFLIGYEAENAAIRGELCQNFKLELLSPDPAVQEKAVNYTELFLKYLCSAYNDQKIHYPTCDSETTYISYPAKWPDTVRDLMISLVEKAGFKNVYGLDEPTAAIHTVMVQESEKLRLNAENCANILMIDMGAGTTDLVLCRYSPYDTNHITLINVWPKADSPSLFGGREIDEVLCGYVKEYLVNCGLPNTKNFKDKYLDKCKTWKETNVSPIFKDKNGVVRYCGFIDTLTAMMDTDIEFPPLSRNDFEDMFREYLTQFVTMINDCLEDAGFDPGSLDNVILTGGHSQWYFTNEILSGSLTKFGRVNLPKIWEDRSRIIKLSRPQETVALGLVYQRINVLPAAGGLGPGQYVYCTICGTPRQPELPYCPFCKGVRNSQDNQYNQSVQGTQYTQHARYGQNTQNTQYAQNAQNTQNTSNTQYYQYNQSMPLPPMQQPHMAGNGNVYPLPAGKSISGLAMVLSNMLQITEKMEAQTINLVGGGVMIQARDKAGKWKQFIGMDKAITVKLEHIDDDHISVNIGEAKWTDKVGVMALSMFILWPLTVTSGIGMFMQGKLPGEIKKTVAGYVYS